MRSSVLCTYLESRSVTLDFMMPEAYFYKTCKTLTKCRRVSFSPSILKIVHVKGQSLVLFTVCSIKLLLLTDGCQNKSKVETMDEVYLPKTGVCVSDKFNIDHLNVSCKYTFLCFLCGCLVSLFWHYHIWVVLKSFGYYIVFFPKGLNGHFGRNF